MITHAISLFLCVLVAGGLAACGKGAAPADLYQAKGFVTGKDERYRQSGFAQGLPDVLIKVSGDPRLKYDPRVAALASEAGTFVDSYTYRDRMDGLPIGDEQGTRDRPFDLAISFKPDSVDLALKSLGREPWTAARPRVVVFLAVRNHARDYYLASDGEFGSDQRDSLAAAAWQIGLPVQVPPLSAMAGLPLAFDAPANDRLQSFSAAAKTAGGDVALTGTMVWSDGFNGWHASWQLTSQGKTYAWKIRDVNFDDAFRNAMQGAAQILSGHGQPE